MRLKFKPFLLFATIITLVALSVVLFLFADSQDFKSYAFWVSYGVSFPLVLLMTALLVIYTNKFHVVVNAENPEFALTRATGLIYSFNVLMVLQGFVLMLIKKINDKVLLSIELVLTTVYLITIIYIVFVYGKKTDSTK